jgi:class 3 adenylate cyclase
MRCPKCTAENAATRRFCARCGASLLLPCPACGFENEPVARFCGGCGKSIGEIAVPASSDVLVPLRADGAERRQLTVMFCDLVGSTALATRLDPEDLQEVIGAYHHCVAEAIGRYDGFVAKYMGDGVLAYFGYPRAHEDDPERAVRSGLAVVEAVRRLPTPELLHVRIGLATGLAVVGDLIGSGAAQERSVIGETPNLAARLQALAGPDQIVIPENTRRLVGNLFEYESLGMVEVKGFAMPMPAFRVIRESRVGSRFEALRTGKAPLVGREEEIELLSRRWTQAKAGTGRVVLIAAEPGMGKSRLAETFRQSLEGEPHTRLRYFCSPYHQDSALFPFIGQLERAAGFEHDDTPAARLDKLERLLAANAPAEGDVPALAELLSLPFGSRYAPLELAPQRKKEKIFQALLRQLAGLVRRQPVLMIFEDLHWADPTSRELLDVTIEQIETRPVLLIATFRPEFQPPWTGQPHVTTLSLRRLGRQESGELMRGITGASAVLSDAVVDEIVERSDGVPLFLEELTKAVVETAISGADPRMGTVAFVPATSPAVPATLHASLTARLDRLGPAAREIAQIGAAIGREFSYELLAGVARQNAAERQDAVGRLVDAGLISQRGAPPHATFLFKHALVRDTAYSTLLRGQRRELHARIGNTLAQNFPEIVETQPEILARHFGQAGFAERACLYRERAGDRAAARSGYAEAFAHFNAGLEEAGKLPDGPERAQRQLAFLLKLGPVLTILKSAGTEEVGNVYRRAHELGWVLGNRPDIFRATWGLWLNANTGRRLEEARRRADELVALGQEMADEDLLLEALHCRWSTAFFRGDAAAALDGSRQGVERYRPDRHSHLAAEFGGHDPGVCAHGVQSLGYSLAGLPEEAAHHRARALSLAEQLGHPHSLAHGIHQAAMSCRILGGRENTYRLAQCLIEVAEKHDFPPQLRLGRFLAGWALAGGSEPTAGLELMEAAFAPMTTTSPFFFFDRACLAEIRAKAGRFADALALLDEALQAVEAPGVGLYLSEIYRVRGECLSFDPQYREAASDALDMAGRIAKQQGARILQLRAAVSKARFWKAAGQPRAAIGELRDICVALEGHHTPDLQEAKKLLDQLA